MCSGEPPKVLQIWLIKRGKRNTSILLPKYLIIRISNTIPNHPYNLMSLDWCAQGSPQSINNVTYVDKASRNKSILVPKYLYFKYDYESVLLWCHMTV